MGTLISGLIKGKLALPLKSINWDVTFAERPVGFICVALTYLLLGALFAWLSIMLLRQRREI